MYIPRKNVVLRLVFILLTIWAEGELVSTYKPEEMILERLEHKARIYCPFSLFKSLADMILCATGRASLAWVKTSGSTPEMLHNFPVAALATIWLGIDAYNTLSPI